MVYIEIFIISHQDFLILKPTSLDLETDPGTSCPKQNPAIEGALKMSRTKSFPSIGQNLRARMTGMTPKAAPRLLYPFPLLAKRAQKPDLALALRTVIRAVIVANQAEYVEPIDECRELFCDYLLDFFGKMWLASVRAIVLLELADDGLNKKAIALYRNRISAYLRDFLPGTFVRQYTLQFLKARHRAHELQPIAERKRSRLPFYNAAIPKLWSLADGREPFHQADFPDSGDSGMVKCFSMMMMPNSIFSVKAHFPRLLLSPSSPSLPPFLSLISLSFRAPSLLRQDVSAFLPLSPSHSARRRCSAKTSLSLSLHAPSLLR